MLSTCRDNEVSWLADRPFERKPLYVDGGVGVVVLLLLLCVSVDVEEKGGLSVAEVAVKIERRSKKSP